LVKIGGKLGIITWQPVDLPVSIVRGNLLNWEPRAEKLKGVSAEFSHVVGRKRRKFNFFFSLMKGSGFGFCGGGGRGSGHRVNKFSQHGQVKELV
jgi:hypothetical protein